MTEASGTPSEYVAKVVARSADLRRLDPKARRLVKLLWAARGGITHELPVAQQRANLRALFANLPQDNGSARDESCAEVDVPLPGRTLRARWYGEHATGSAPILLYLHGGGWTLGDLWLADSQCRELAAACSARVLNLAYRLAPENRFPAAYDDVADTVDWLRERNDPRRIVLVGDSSGANLAAAVAQARPDAIAAQVLVYPQVVTTARGDLLDLRYDDFFVSAEGLASFERLYLGGADPADPRFAPLLGPGLGGLPPALLVLAECDPLRPHGAAYHRALCAAGTPAQARTMPGMIHGFFGLSSVLAPSAEAVHAIADFLAPLRTGPNLLEKR
ncbi:alpha/beta hydrolase [Amycolatopsis sp. NPDC004079]|uniref:alpha/beta hydrolase n=1 Tax=Amycolatopsis sp. NPDC004079 TaxID=3154549 RepID=UPI0033BB7514